MSGDPAYDVACRGCGARPGTPCRRAEGGNERVCFQRDRDALREGLLPPCTGLSWDGRHDKPLRLSAAPIAEATKIHTGAPVSRTFA